MKEYFNKIPSVDSLLQELSNYQSKFDQKYIKRCIENNIKEVKDNKITLRNRKLNM